ncbi:MAG: DUF6055 domain-containing protein [Paludibacter sp.]|nr:DUF6055 domain-containing protein [Paludibacter sp.]
MSKKSLQRFLIVFCMISGLFVLAENQAGDTITINNKKFKLLSENLISNPGFENGFTGWTDATSSAATLSSSKFSIATTGGVDNSKYLIGLYNENSSSAGSIGTGWALSAGKSYLFAFQVKYLDSSVAASTELYLKTSLTNSKTSSAEPKILLDGAQVNGGGVWTQNYVFFTNTSPAYSYIVARFRWLNNSFGIDDFMLYEATEVANNDELQTVITEAEALYDTSLNGAANLLAAIDKAKTFLDSFSASDIENAIADLQKAIRIYKYANASEENPVDMTDFIENQGFDDNTTTGWEGAGTVNYHEVEFYQKTFNMYQTLTGLPAGKYRLKARGFERPKLNDGGAAYKAGTETIYARIYAQAAGYTDVSVPFNSIYKHPYTGTESLNGYVNTMSAAATMITNTANTYYEMTLENILLNEGGTLTIGAKSEFQQDGCWVLFDNFRLEYLGSAGLSDLVLAINNRIVEAQYLLTQKIQNTAVSELNVAISKAQEAASAELPAEADLAAAKDTIDAAIETAYTSLNAYVALKKTIDNANTILGFLEKTDEIVKLQNAIEVANTSYDDLDLTLAEINNAATTLKNVTKSVGKQIYVPTWMMGDVYDATNSWSIERSRQSKNWILFWESGFGDDPGSIVDACLVLAEKSFAFYADSLKFIQKGSSKTDIYKMIIRLRYSSDWEASGSGVDNTIGLLTLTSSALSSRGGQTIAHEVGHCFQYQVHCDNNDSNGWMYGFGDNASGGNGWWEQCAQWQAYKVFPEQQFTNEWFSGYLSHVHKHILHESTRYEDYFIQDYWCDLHGMDFIGRLWNESVNPEDPVETYKRLTGTSQSEFNDEMWTCAAKFTTWDIPALKNYGASVIASRTQPKLKNMGNYVWQIDSTACIENYGHNIIRLNAPTAAKTVFAYFQGLAGTDGYRKNYVGYAGWRCGFVTLLKDGTRVYSNVNTADMSVNEGKETFSFECPDNCNKLWFVISGAPRVHWRHAWDDDDSNDEQWPYQISFNNTNVYGYANVYNALDEVKKLALSVRIKNNVLMISEIPASSKLRIYRVTGSRVVDENVVGTKFSVLLSSGIYIVSVVSDSGIYTEKIMMP